MIYTMLLAITLSLDAFAASVTTGLDHPGNNRDICRTALWFGAFQFSMPLFGLYFGNHVGRYVHNFAPLISFLLLGYIGIRMIWDAVTWEAPAAARQPQPPPLSDGRLFSLALATSLDAFAAGIVLAFLPVNLWTASLMIGITAFLLSLFGGYLGGKLGLRFQQYSKLAGGLILFGIGLKIIMDNL